MVSIYKPLFTAEAQSIQRRRKVKKEILQLFLTLRRLCILCASAVNKVKRLVIC